VEDLPDRMKPPAEMLESTERPALSPRDVKAPARDLRARTKQLRAAVDAAGAPNAPAQVLGRARRATATVDQRAPATLQRVYRKLRSTEDSLHVLTPDRPASPRTLAPAPAPDRRPPRALAGTPPALSTNNERARGQNCVGRS
jgi:hypothetical protein